MKERCQCGKPDFIAAEEMPDTSPDNMEGFDYPKYIVDLGEPTLHFKSADRHCEKCGAALCAECATTIEHEEESQFYKGLMVIVNQVVCRTCAEIANE